VGASTHTANSLDADADTAAAAVAASSAACWAVKGEGNANVVLAYTGADPALVSEQ
jgi:hypothetical protein